MISRNIVESEIWDKPPLYIKVWLYLLTRAQHSDYRKLKRGQLVTSIPEIIEACSWKVGFRTERPSKSQIFQVLDWLRKLDEAGDESNTSATMITTTKATHGMLVNIENYDFYQTSKNYESNNDSNNEKDTKATREQRQPDNINKNVNNAKNKENKEMPIQQAEHFDSWWNLYGKKEGRAKCEKKFEQLVKKYSYEIIEQGTKGYLDHRERLRVTGEFVPAQKNPLTFLNGEHFNDEYESKPHSIEPVTSQVSKPFFYDITQGED
ncbi:MAG: hypothetical protein ABTA16_03350 [Niallia sp.]